MKALVITAIASFFALSASAQSAVDTKTTGTLSRNKVSTGTTVPAERPAKVATSTTPTFTNAGATTHSKDKLNAPGAQPATNDPAGNVVPAATKKEGKTQITPADDATPKK